MKIEGPRQIESARVTRARPGAGAPGAFAAETAHEAHAAPTPSGAAPIATVEALIALQEVPQATAGRAKAVRRGRDMLELLEDIRDGLLLGGISRTTLQRLLALVNVKREEFTDEGLAALLDDIELRARVELAKLNFATAN